jgi:hypothetical protein
VGSSSSETNASHRNDHHRNYSLKNLAWASSCQTYQIRNWSIRYPSCLNHSSHQIPIPSPTDHPLDKRQPAGPTHRLETAARPDCSGNEQSDNDAADADTACWQNNDCRNSATWSMRNQ